MTGAEVREMKGLAVGLSTEDLVHMNPVDIRESVHIFAQNAKKMKKTQKREIIKQVKYATQESFFLRISHWKALQIDF